MQNIRLAFRSFLNSPGFSLTVVLTIALGIGANTAIFTLVHAVLMKSLPVVDPKTLYRIGDRSDCCDYGGFPNDDGDFDLFSYDLYRHLRDSTPEFEQLAAMQSGSKMVAVRRGGESATSERSEYVSGNYFSVFGVGVFAGRALTNADDTPGAPPAVMMSYQTWRSDYGADPSVVGSTLFVQSQPVTLVGIAPPGFFGDRITSDPPDLWIPLAIEPVMEQGNSILKVPDSNWLYAIGRIRPGTGVGSLQAKVSNALRVWLGTQPGYARNSGPSGIQKQHVVLTPAGAGIQNMQQETGKGLQLLMSISGLVLLVACANVANLLLARGATRKTETSIRMALGAARSRLIRQMLTESVLLGLIGGVAGLALAYAGARTILSLAFPDSLHLPIQANPSLPILGFAFLLSLTTGIIFGIVPAWITSHSHPAEALRGTNRSTRDRASLPQKSLIMFQAALSVVLLVSAGLLTKTLRNLESQDFGIQTTNRYVLHLDPSSAGYGPEKLPVLNQKLEQAFAALPRVQSVGLGLYGALEGNNWGEGIGIEGRPDPGPNEDTVSSWDRVSPRFFETVGQPVIRGRGFTDADTATSQMVAVVNQAFVKKFFPTEDPIGRHFGSHGQKFSGAFEIVGIVANAKYINPRDEAQPMFFRPLSQPMRGLADPNAVTGENRSLFINSITLRFKSPPQNLDAMVRHTLGNIDPNLTIIDLHSLDYQVNGNFNQERLIARLTASFGLLALVLASVGLYGMTAYAVARRTSEIGVRMALGADRGNVLLMVLRGAFTPVGLGLALGTPVAFLAGRLLGDQLYGVRSYDPLSMLIAVGALSLAAVVAALIPARRASSIEPMEALRTD